MRKRKRDWDEEDFARATKGGREGEMEDAESPARAGGRQRDGD